MPALAASLSTDSGVLTTLFRAALDVSLTGFILFQPLYADGQRDTVIDLAYVYLNPAAQRQLRLPECPTGSFLTLFPHATQTGVFAFYRDTFLAGGRGRYEVDYFYDGLDSRFVLSAQRSDDLLLVSFIDTADQPRTALEDALRTSQAREQAAHTETEAQRQQLYQTFQEAPAMICVFDGPQHVFQFVNPPYQALVGNRPLVGKPIAEAMPELAGQPIFELLDGVYRTGETFQANEMLVQLDHDNTGAQKLENRYYNFIYKARHTSAGHIDGIFVFAYEVTTQVLARQQVQHLNEELAAINEELRASNEEFLASNVELLDAQQQLRQLNQELEDRVLARTQEVEAARAAQYHRLSELFEQAPVAIAVFRGPDYVLDVVNPSMAAMWHRTPEELVGWPFFFVLPKLQQGLRQLLDEVRTAGVAYTAYEQAVQLAHHGPGEEAYFSYVYQPLREAPGRPAAIACVAVDVTAQVLARQQVQRLNEELAAINEEMQTSNEELNEANDQLTRTNVDLDNFIYTASHDLKQPIANIEGLLLALTYQLPAEAQQDELVAPILERMQGAIDRFKRTIADLTEVSKLQQSYVQPAQTLSLAQLVAEVQLDLAPVLLEAQGQLEVDVAGCPAVTFSEKNMRSVIYNLLSNALKYRAPERPVRVQLTCAQVGQQVQLRVQDNGLGLDERQQSRLFGLFQRLHTHVEGTGIGLYMVKKMVENAKGTITVQSQLGVGSTFTVSLPI